MSHCVLDKGDIVSKTLLYMINCVIHFLSRFAYRHVGPTWRSLNNPSHSFFSLFCVRILISHSDSQSQYRAQKKIGSGFFVEMRWSETKDAFTVRRKEIDFGRGSLSRCVKNGTINRNVNHCWICHSRLFLGTQA